MAPDLEDFEGAWHLERDIVHADGSTARFFGRAVWSRGDDGLTYRESGKLTIAGGASVQAERRYIWKEQADGRIGVYFADGRPFHLIDPQRPEDRHFCDPDLYDVEYDFSDWPNWSCRWVVKGPLKDYRMSTTYKREDG